MTLAEADRYLLGATAALAVVLAWRARGHRPFAVWAAGQALVQLGARLAWKPYLRTAIAAAGGDLDAGIRPLAPLVGWGRVVGLADLAAWLSWPASFAMLALWCFAEVPADPMTKLWPSFAALRDAWRNEDAAKVARRRTVAACFATWFIVVTTVCLDYPAHRDLYPRLDAAAQVAAVLVSVVALGGAAIRRYKRRERFSPSALCVAVIVVVEAGTLAGSYAWGLFGAAWNYDRMMTAVMYAFLVLLQGGLLVWRSR